MRPAGARSNTVSPRPRLRRGAATEWWPLASSSHAARLGAIGTIDRRFFVCFHPGALT